MAAPNAVTVLETKSRRYTREFNVLVDRAAARWTPRAETVLVNEGRRAAIAYVEGGEAAALAEAKPLPWHAFLDRVWLSTVPAAGELTAETLVKATGNVFIDAALLWLHLHGENRVLGINATSREIILSQIRLGLSKGENEQQIAERIVKHSRETAPERGRGIAETETHAAANYGSIVAARDTEMPLVKIWVALNDGRTRATHAAAHGQRRPMDEPFQVGAAHLDYPGAVGPAEETIRCRCSLIYEREARPAGRRRVA